jgi:type III pantothenate kinase
VGDRAVISRIKELSKQWSSLYQEAYTSSSAAGVECGYLDPNALGVDRWLAIIAAYKKSGKACVVVDMGTAITVDIINERGMHLGGYIVPGLTMMNEALYRGTRQVKVDAQAIDDIAPGRVTEMAVANGCLLMIKSMVYSALSDINTPSAELFVTGGDGEKLMAVLECDATYSPDLVMDGLQYVVP